MECFVRPFPENENKEKRSVPHLQYCVEVQLLCARIWRRPSRRLSRSRTASCASAARWPRRARRRSELPGRCVKVCVGVRSRLVLHPEAVEGCRHLVTLEASRVHEMHSVIRRFRHDANRLFSFFFSTQSSFQYTFPIGQPTYA